MSSSLGRLEIAASNEDWLTHTGWNEVSEVRVRKRMLVVTERVQSDQPVIQDMFSLAGVELDYQMRSVRMLRGVSET